MLTENSILSRLPPGLDPKQLVFLDGIRHAAEIIGLAYFRLESDLTSLVLNSKECAHPPNHTYIAAFMDAWALVDAVDRFRLLWKMLPGFPFSQEGESKQKEFEKITQPFRDLRNVTDHLAQRADYVGVSGNPVLGLLTWITYPDGAASHGYTCLLAPGTTKRSNWRLVNPAEGGYFSSPLHAGAIHLAAGDHRANLSSVIPEITLRIQVLEGIIETSLKELGIEGKQAGGDLFAALAFNVGSSAERESKPE